MGRDSERFPFVLKNRGEDFSSQMEQYTLSVNKMRRDVTAFENLSVEETLFPTEPNAYFTNEHGNRVTKQTVQWFFDHSG